MQNYVRYFGIGMNMINYGTHEKMINMSAAKCWRMNGDIMKKMISWNVNGLRAVMGKNFMEDFQKLDADIFCLQETKLQEGQIELELPGYHQYWNYAGKKGYSGTALFTKEEPINVTYGMGIEEHDQEGRVITAEFENYYVLTVYLRSLWYLGIVQILFT